MENKYYLLTINQGTELEDTYAIKKTSIYPTATLNSIIKGTGLLLNVEDLPIASELYIRQVYPNAVYMEPEADNRIYESGKELERKAEEAKRLASLPRTKVIGKTVSW